MAFEQGKRVYGPAQPGTSAATIYTAGGRSKTHIVCIHICNTTSAEASITMSIGTDAANTRLLSGTKVPANGLLVLNGSWFLDSDEFIQAFQGTSSALTVTITAIEEEI